MESLVPTLASTAAHNGTLSDVATYAILGCPIGIVMGIGMVAIGFTAWAVIVPLLFAGFRLQLYDSLFISAFLELVASLISAIIYGVKKAPRLDMCLVATPFAFGVTAMSTVFLSGFLLKIKELFRGSISIFSFLLGVLFLIKGVFDCVQYHRKKNKEKKEAFDRSVNETGTANKPLLGNSSGAMSINDDPNAANAHAVQAAPTDEQPDQQKSKLHEMACCQTNAWRYGRYVLFAAALLLASLGAGMLAFGGGFIFSVLMMIFLRYSLHEATGSAVVIMLGTMSAYCLSVICMGQVHWNLIWPYLLLSFGYQTLGTILGGFIALKVPRQGIFLLVAVTVLISGVFATVQHFFFPKKELK